MLLTVGAQPHFCSGSRCSDGDCVGGGGLGGAFTVPGDRLCDSKARSSLDSDVFLWKYHELSPNTSTLHEEVGKQTTWIIRLCSVLPLTEKS